MSDISNCENKLFSSPVITLHGKQLGAGESPRTPRETLMVRNSPRRLNGRYSSPRGSPRRAPNSTKISSRLPIRSSQNLITRFSIKDLHLPPDDSITNSQSSINNKVTPEKLMEELREEVKKKQRKLKELDDEISLSIPFTGIEELIISEGSNESMRPRMSLRNRCPVMVDAPDLVYEDPLDVARQTLQNTRANTGYRHIKLIYTTERRSMTRSSSSPEPAFSKKKGIRRHLLNLFEDEEEQLNSGGKLKFDRVLKLFEVDRDSRDIEENSGFEYAIKYDNKPLKPCLKQPFQVSSLNNNKSTASESENPKKPQIVQVKRICYDGDEEEESVPSKSMDPPVSPTKKRRIGSGNGIAKRLKKPED